ncbi:DUF6156 family protein [Methylocapsa sp. D3K7]|uniref:DUF6156 family protein n=1 Tax=Methylocapsa sp. D3K7 TaxID=3041435 RepID=UPI00244E8CF0|nr:DUF6156 family protein [Methylocapsa sp. D3K7]WGJ13215.1 DUF6156 family protein [Methylocapsa sp. D3K7]
MKNEVSETARFFVSYTGIKLPFNLVNPIAKEALTNRNTYIRAYFNETGALSCFEKIVYGEIELAHRYEYYGNGSLKTAEISTPEEESLFVYFDVTGVRLSEG